MALRELPAFAPTLPRAIKAKPSGCPWKTQLWDTWISYAAEQSPVKVPWSSGPAGAFLCRQSWTVSKLGSPWIPHNCGFLLYLWR